MGKKKSKAGQYAIYAQEGRYNKNLVAKLKRHLKRQPNDEVAQAALKAAAGKAYSRKASNKKGNYPAEITRVRDKAGNTVYATTFVGGKYVILD